jgi:hypothetical protein
VSWLDEHFDIPRPRWKQLLFDDGAMPWVLVSLGLALLWLLFFLVEIQSESAIYWYGDSVVGSNQGGIVFYHVHGEQYTIDDTGPTPPHPEPRTVYYDPQNPYVSMLDSPLRLGEEALFVGLIAGSVVSLGVGVATGELHRRRRRDWAERQPAVGHERTGADSSRTGAAGRR